MYDALSVFVGFISFFYLIISVQLYLGFPPFYREFKVAYHEIPRTLMNNSLWFTGMFMMIALVAITGNKLFFVGFGICAIRIAFYFRTELSTQTNIPFPWLRSFLSSTLPFLNPSKRPMLAFDLWSLGLCFLIALIWLV